MLKGVCSPYRGGLLRLVRRVNQHPPSAAGGTRRSVAMSRTRLLFRLPLLTVLALRPALGGLIAPDPSSLASSIAAPGRASLLLCSDR